jgi:DNA-binding CsgD family transcriptional regulator
MPSAEPIGRNEELAAIERLLTQTRKGPGILMLEGVAGIGKTILWLKGLERAREHGFRVLSCRPSSSETPLAFSALGDLLGELGEKMLRKLPPPQRRALEIGLLLRETDSGTLDQRAISLATLTLIRTAAEKRPLLIAIDDVQWLDASSARVLAFVFRRIEYERCRVLLACRIEDGAATGFPLDLEWAPSSLAIVERVTVGPLSLGAIQRLIRSRLSARLPRQLLVSICEASGGHPFFALELARAQIERGALDPGEPLQVPESLRGLLSKRLSAFPLATQETLLLAATLFDPTVELLRKAGARGLAGAIEAGVAELDGERVRFTHPLHASVIYSQITPEHRRELHRRLVDVAPSAEERARHLALGSEKPGEEVAAELDQAALQAESRGAAEAAAELYNHAARLTPPEQVEKIRDRRIQTAENYYVAGDLARARTLAKEILAEFPPGPWCADVLVLLSDLVEDLHEAADLCRQAMEAARGDDRRLALANIRLGAAQARLADQPAQLNAQRAALKHAERSGDQRLIVEALQGVVNATVLGGGEIDEAAMKRAIAIESEIGSLPVRHSPRFWLGDQLHLTDELDRARPLLEEAFERSAQEGEITDRLHILLPLVDLETRAGNWDLAAHLVAEGLELALDVGQEYTSHFLQIYRLQLDVLHGRIEHVRPAIADLVAQAERAADVPQLAYLHSLAGFTELSAGKAEAASQRLEPAIQLQRELGRSWCCNSAINYCNIVPNAIEALVKLDRLETATSLLADMEKQTENTTLPSRIITRARSRALIAAAQGDLEAAGAALGDALEAHERLSDPFERGRTLLALGTLERRGKRKRDAREALEQAHEIFTGLGALLWVKKVEVELKRVSGRRDSGSGLTPTEQQVAELVVAGRSNREVAAKLFMSVRTVETNLTNIYRKLDVNSRAELVGRLHSEKTKFPENR